MKKMLSLAMIACLTMGLTACDGEKTSSSTAPAETSAQTAQETDSADDYSKLEKVAWQIGSTQSAENGTSVAMQALADWVTEQTDGQFTIHFFPGSQLGDEPSMHEAIKNGSMTGFVSGISEVGKDYAPALIYDAPFLFENYEHLLASFESEVGIKLWSDFEEASGIKMVAPLYLGTRQLTINGKSVEKPEDLAGMKIRVPDQENYVTMWKMIGAAPTAMNLPEVYLALQTGAVDAVETPISTTYANKLHEPATNVSLTNHIVQALPLFVSSSAYESLPAEYCSVLQEGIEKFIDPQPAEMVAAEQEIISEMEATGIIVNETDHQAFVDALEEYVALYAETTWGEGLFEAFQSVEY